MGWKNLVPLKPPPDEVAIQLLNELWKDYTWEEIVERIRINSAREKQMPNPDQV